MMSTTPRIMKTLLPLMMIRMMMIRMMMIVMMRMVRIVRITTMKLKMLIAEVIKKTRTRTRAMMTKMMRMTKTC